MKLKFSGVFVLLLLACLLVMGFNSQLARVGAISQTGSVQATDTDWWPMFHHDLAHSGYSTSTAPATNQTLWTDKTLSWVVSSPAVSGGVVYVGSEDENVYALNATTGALVWKYATGGDVDSSPAVSGGIVYVGSTDENVYALNATTGALVWKYATNGYVASSPAVANGVVYVGSYDLGGVYAFSSAHSYSSPSYSVSFSESGLPAGTFWSVTFNGATSRGSYNYNTVTFAGVKNGSYSYTVGSVPSYMASPSTGSVTVNGANASVQITFTEEAPVGGVSVSTTTFSFLSPWLSTVSLLVSAILLKGFITKKKKTGKVIARATL